MADQTGRTAGHVYSDLIAGQLAEERAAKGSLEQRAASGVTWAGGLVAASLALLSTLAESPVAAAAVFVAATLLVIAAYVGTRVITPADYEEAAIPKLRAVIGNPALMVAEEQEAMGPAAEQALDILEAARARNKTKATALRWELRFLAAGTAFLALAVATVAFGIVCTSLRAVSGQ